MRARLRRSTQGRRRRVARWLVQATWLLFMLFWGWSGQHRIVWAQTPPPSPTGTPLPAVVRVVGGGELQVNVRSGPAVTFPAVGVLVVGEEVPALGRTPGGDWVKVIYPGAPEGVAWVFSPYVRLIRGELPILEVPPTPVPDTPTPDPTLAAQFNLAPPPTRLPTFTPAPTLAEIVFPPEQGPLEERFPVGLVVVLLFTLGLLGLAVAYLRGR